jgi:hypothetical protein
MEVVTFKKNPFLYFFKQKTKAAALHLSYGGWEASVRRQWISTRLLCPLLPKCVTKGSVFSSLPPLSLLSLSLSRARARSHSLLAPACACMIIYMPTCVCVCVCVRLTCVGVGVKEQSLSSHVGRRSVCACERAKAVLTYFRTANLFHTHTHYAYFTTFPSSKRTHYTYFTNVWTANLFSHTCVYA